jgi:integrase
LPGGVVCLKTFQGGIDMAKVQGRRKGVKYFFIETAKQLFEMGKGKSKHQAMQESFEKNKNRRVDAIYSHSTYETYKEVLAKFADYIEKEYKIRFEKDFRKLSTDEIYTYIDKYFEKQKADGLAKKTLQKHVSALYKVLSAINPEITKRFDADSRVKWTDGAEKQECDRYNNPDRIVENLHRINQTAEAIAQLQRLVGCRIGDVKKIKIDEINRKVIIEKSKGGRSRSVYFDYFPQEFEKVKEYKEILDRALEQKSFSEIRKNEYYSALKQACRKAGEVYHGSHAFRYEWAQRTYDVIKDLPRVEQVEFYIRILEERGLSNKDILKAFEEVKQKDAFAEGVISEELGHSRLDISYEYLKLKGK